MTVRGSSRHGGGRRGRGLLSLIRQRSDRQLLSSDGLVLSDATSSGDGWKWNQQPSVPFLPLDDPVLGSIKRHLNTAPRIGFEPISQRFARIAFFFKSRMEMKLISFRCCSRWEWPEKSSLQLLVKTKTGENERSFHISDIERAFRSLFCRIRKWRSVDFDLQPIRSWCYPNDVDWIHDHIVNQILWVIVDESRPTVFVRRFRCRLLNLNLQERMADFVNNCAPILRCLSLGARDSGSLLSSLVQAIGACQELRRLCIESAGIAERFASEFLPMLQGLENLDGLRIGFWRSGALVAARHSLSITSEWLPFFAEPAFYPLFKKMEHLNVDEQWRNSLTVANLAQIITEMRSAVRVVIGRFDIDWPVIWDDYLPIVHSTRASILIRLRYDGLRRLTAEKYATGLSTLPAILQTSLISPDLQNSPVDQHNRYLELQFRFSGGGQLTVKRDD